MMDWGHFFNFEKSEGWEEAQANLKRVLSNTKWQEKIEKRTAAFYQIISKIVEIIHMVVQASQDSSGSNQAKGG